MPYNQNIPQPNDRLRNSQADLLANFQEIYTFLDQDHVIFGNADAGKHKFCTFPEQGAAPATLANEGALYSRVGPNSAVSELAFRRESDGAEIIFTEGRNNAVSGWARFGSGLVMKWERFPVAAAVAIVSRTDSFVWSVDATIPAFAAVPFNIQVQIYLDAVQNDEKPSFAVRYDLGQTTDLRTNITFISPFVLGGWDAFNIFIIAFGQ